MNVNSSPWTTCRTVYAQFDGVGIPATPIPQTGPAGGCTLETANAPGGYFSRLGCIKSPLGLRRISPQLGFAAALPAALQAAVRHALRALLL